jgi:hypothetical protein
MNIYWEGTHIVCIGKVESDYKCQKGVQQIDDLKGHSNIHNFQLLVKFPT